MSMETGFIIHFTIAIMLILLLVLEWAKSEFGRDKNRRSFDREIPFEDRRKKKKRHITNDQTTSD